MSKDTSAAAVNELKNKDSVTPPTLPTNPDIETIVLEQPVQRGDLTISQININKPKTGALRGLSLADVMKLDVDVLIKLTPRVSTPPITEHEAADLDLADLMKVATAVIGFFGTAKQRKEAREKAEAEASSAYPTA